MYNVVQVYTTFITITWYLLQLRDINYNHAIFITYKPFWCLQSLVWRIYLKRIGGGG